MPFDEAADLVRRCATPYGFVASPVFEHYAGVWMRDAALIGLGALTLGDEPMVAVAGATLDTVLERASGLGQVPAAVWAEIGRWDWGEGGVADSSAWAMILAGAVARTLGGLPERWRRPLEAAMRWLSYQDVTGSGLLSVAPSTDWMDAALTRSGRTLHVNVLYAWAAQEARRWEISGPDPDDLIRRINLLLWPEPGVELADLYPHGFSHEASRIAHAEASQSRRHYLSHVVHAAFVDRCDVLANLLAIVAGVADRHRGLMILDYLDHSEVAEPYPSRAFPVPIQARDPSAMWITAAESVIPDRWRNRPGRYHNGGVWPYIGAIHAWAAATCGRRWQAERLLSKVKRANRLGEGFPEWIHPDTGEAHGTYQQGWNAGTYLVAEAALGALV
jgi:hypothetical protein